MAKLPLDKYLLWNPGSGKSLALSHVLKILLDYKATEDWNTAFLNVPRRKIVPGPEYYNKKYNIAFDNDKLSRNKNHGASFVKKSPSTSNRQPKVIQELRPFFKTNTMPVTKKNIPNQQRFGLMDDSS